MGARTIQVLGYPVYLARNRYVEERLLEEAPLRAQILEKIAHCIENPDYPTYRQVKHFQNLHRIWLFNDRRLFLRIHPQGVVVIAALETARHIKRNEMAGNWDNAFIATMRYFVRLDVGNIVPWMEKVEETAPAELLPKTEKINIDVQPLSEYEADQILCYTCGGRKRDPFINKVFDAARRDKGESRVLIDPEVNGRVLTPEELRDYRRRLGPLLKEEYFDYSVRIDDLSGKLMLVPKDKVKIYCMPGRSQSPGRRGVSKFV